MHTPQNWGGEGFTAPNLVSERQETLQKQVSLLRFTPKFQGSEFQPQVWAMWVYKVELPNSLYPVFPGRLGCIPFCSNSLHSIPKPQSMYPEDTFLKLDVCYRRASKDRVSSATTCHKKILTNFFKMCPKFLVQNAKISGDFWGEFPH